MRTPTPAEPGELERQLGLRPELHCIVYAHHWAPFPERITFTVSMTIVRSKTIDRCLM